jgi:sulfate transporter 4
MRFVVIEMSPVSHIDASAVRMLRDLLTDYRTRGLQLVVSNPSTRVFRAMERAGLPDLIGVLILEFRVFLGERACPT